MTMSPSAQSDVLNYLSDLEWTPEKGDRAILRELANYPEAVGLRKVIITLCLTRSDPATGIEDIPVSNDPTTIFVEIAKFAFMFALVAGHRMARSGFPEQITPEKRSQLISLELEKDPEKIAALAELYRSGLTEVQDRGGFTALELLELEFQRDPRSRLYLSHWASRAEFITRPVAMKSAGEAKEIGRNIDELWWEIFSVGTFAGLTVYESK
jgi:heme-degrading monooxygenase HmoA